MPECDVVSLSNVLVHIPHYNLQMLTPLIHETLTNIANPILKRRSMSSQAMHYLKSLHLDGEGYEASRNSLQEEISPRRLEQY